MISLMVAALVLSSLGCYNALADDKKDSDPHMTGLPPLTLEQEEMIKKTHARVKKVKLNKLGLERVNKHRKKKGLSELPEDYSVEKGKEVIAEVPSGNPSSYVEPSSVPEGSMPTYVDNSQLKYFPPIRSQGSLNSCGPFSGTYYTMTYMYALEHDLDAKIGGDNNRLSPKWTNNFLNGGNNSGGWYFNAFTIGINHGAMTWEEFPYDSNYKQWCMNTQYWKNTLSRRFESFGYINGTNTDEGMQQVKDMLLNGYVLNFPTYINSWQSTTISDDPSTTADDAFVGKSACYWVNGYNGYHAMTVVGYNDDIWVDVNQNGVVNSGEKGAFRIANSWGTGWREGGFSWMAYDALKNSSSVSGGPSKDRVMAWSPCLAYWVKARKGYSPKMIAEFTINNAKRNQIKLTLGTSDIASDLPTTVLDPNAFVLSHTGGPFAFDGTTTACDGTFVLDFTEILPTDGAVTKYYLRMYDFLQDDISYLKEFKIIDLTKEINNIAVATDTPMETDYIINSPGVYSALTYQYGNPNTLPVASLLATPTSGFAPLAVTLSGAGSYDPDGNIASYEWVFGDGQTAIGVDVEHTYNDYGDFTASLTVIDDRGATAQDTIIITAIKPNIPPVAIATVTSSSAYTENVLGFSGANSYDPDGALVLYEWDFGDGQTAIGVDVDHIYAAVGVYDVVLKVTDEKGANAIDIVNISVTVEPVIVDAPVNLVVEIVGSDVVLNWTDNSGNETGFYIERALKVRGKYNFQRVGEVLANINTYSEDVSAGSYKYRVQAYNNMGVVTDYTNEIKIDVIEESVDPDPSQLSPPADLSATASGVTVTLNWTDNSGNETGFYIERALKVRGKYNFQRVGEVLANINTYSEDVSAGSYKYRVQAYGNVNNEVSTYSNEAKIDA